MSVPVTFWVLPDNYKYVLLLIGMLHCLFLLHSVLLTFARPHAHAIRGGDRTAAAFAAARHCSRRLALRVSLRI
eukprot:6186968-Pleurochrysis_carterae.AAC.1